MGGNGYLGNTKVGYFHSLNDKTQLGASVSKNLEDANSKPKFELGVNGKCTDKFSSRVKVSSLFQLDQCGKFSLSMKYVFDKLLTLTGSMEMNCASGKCPIDYKNYYFTPFGYQLDFNY